MFLNRRFISEFFASTCSTRSHKRAIADSASSLALLEQHERMDQQT